MSLLDFELPPQLRGPKPLTSRHPRLLPAAQLVHRAQRRWQWWTAPTEWTRTWTDQDLPVRVLKHKSLLLRELGESDMWLQHNKVTNLRLACNRMDGVLLKPGETWSFNRIVGNCTRRKGYVDGMKLSSGQAEPGVGGGICQLANLVHWMALHSPLTVVERSEHSFDPFPDNGRVLPWGVGCSIVYNYVDLVVRNDTDTTFQVRVEVGPRHLEGSLRADRPLSTSYGVEARDELFLRHQGEIYRRNEIWRTLTDRRTGNRIGEERVKVNCARVVYTPVGVDVVDVV